MSGLVATGVGQRFDGRTALHGVSFHLEPGQVLGLIGPNGGGKSTLLALLAGLGDPDEGSVSLDDRPIAVWLGTGAVGLVATDAGLYPLLTGRENLRYFGGLYGMSAADVDAAVAPILAALEVGAAIDRPTRTYSAGMRQKVSLARALMGKPRLLLLDEPTANLDPLSAHTLFRAIRAEADRGVAVVLCTHDLAAVPMLCDRLLVLRQTVIAAPALQRRPPPPPSPWLEYFREPAAAATASPDDPPAGRRAAPPWLHVAAREVREQTRQPSMLLVVGSLYAVIGATSIASLLLLARLRADPVLLEVASDLLGVAVDITSLQRAVTTLTTYLTFSQYLGVSAVLAGHALLHERQCGTLSFVLLAPIRGATLVAGKVLGALVGPTLLFIGAEALTAAAAAATASPPSRAWLAIVGAAPAWAFATSVACAWVSAVVRDVRAAQQGAWFIVFFATLGAGGLLTAASSFVAYALATAAGAVVGAALLGAAGGSLRPAR